MLFCPPVTRFHNLTRGVVVVLLLFAATDLSFPAGCDDAHAMTPVGPAWCAGSDASEPGHGGDDCFCCSRTVRTASVATLLPYVEDAPAPIAASPGPRPAAVRRLYHPPIA